MGRFLSALVVGIMLASCSGSDDEEAPEPPPLPSAVTSEPPTEPSGAPEPAVGNVASDGICQVTIPGDWSDDGTARGSTSTGARWTLFGNRLDGDAEWLSAVTLLKDQQGARPGAVVDEQPDTVTVTQAENRAIVVRRRFADRYCELGVAGTGTVSPETAAQWTSVAAGLGPVEDDPEAATE